MKNSRHTNYLEKSTGRYSHFMVGSIKLEVDDQSEISFSISIKGRYQGNHFLLLHTGCVKKVSGCTVIDISKARQYS